MAFHTRKQSSVPPVSEQIHKYTGTLVHLTHNDLDAAGSDAVVRMKYGDNILTFFSSVGKFPWFLGQIGLYGGKNRTLLISDLGYQPGCEKKIAGVIAAGWNVQWYDHHQWNMQEIEEIAKHNVALTVDPTRCATGILAEKLHPEHAGEVARVVCDYDLWKQKDPRSSILGIVTSGAQNLELVRDKLKQGIIIDTEISKIHAKMEAEKNACIRKSLNRAKITDGKKYRTAIMPCYGYPTETAAECRKKFNTDIELLVFETGRFSLRSKPDISHLIAYNFNGGGHPNASGGSFDYKLPEKIKFKLFHIISEKDNFIQVAESY